MHQPKPSFELNRVDVALPRWAAFVAIMLFIGALALRLLVVAPVTRRPQPGDAELLAACDRRLLPLAAIAIVCFVPATLAQLVWQVAGKTFTGSFWQAIDPAGTWTYLTKDPDGHLWLARLIVTAVAVAVTVPVALAARRSRSSRAVGRVAAVALALGVGELLGRAVPATRPDAFVREWFTSILDWAHMLSAAIWIGGLVGLVVLGATLRIPNARRGGFWSPVLRRFSLVAMASVGVVVLTGLWTAWIHVGGLGQLVSTLYGETLLVKLVLVAGLVGLGAFNHLWLRPRLPTVPTDGDDRPPLGAVLRRFRVVIATEATLGILVLLVVPFLSGSARNQAFQTRAADLTQTRGSGAARVSLTPSAELPVPTDYDVQLASPTAGPVVLTFAAAGRAAQRAVATRIGDGHYRVTGRYTPAAGSWRVDVSSGGVARAASFTLPVVAKAPKPGKAPPPTIRTSTWLWGTGQVIVVVSLLLGVAAISRRRRRPSPPALDALVPALADQA